MISFHSKQEPLGSEPTPSTSHKFSPIKSLFLLEQPSGEPLAKLTTAQPASGGLNTDSRTGTLPGTGISPQKFPGILRGSGNQTATTRKA